jgi:quinol monooxygenase YgiN
MAIGVIFDGNGMNQDQYEQVNQQVSPNNRPPAGLLYHAAGRSDGGFCIIEVWESQEALQEFFAQQLGLALQQAGVTAQPRMFEVINTMQA